MTERGFHPFAVLHFLRKTILLYLLPLLQVLFFTLATRSISCPAMAGQAMQNSNDRNRIILFISLR